MILAAAVVLGLVACLLRYGRGAFSQIASIPLRWAWLVLLALAMQWPLLRTGAGPPHEIRVQQALFLLSHLLLLSFFWKNWRQAAVLVVALGVCCNLLVMLANGGLMPITPETLVRINPGSSVQQWPEGIHYVRSKDVIMAKESTRLWALSDVLVVQRPFPWPTAFSVGDLIIAAGIVALLTAPKWRIERRIRNDS